MTQKLGAILTMLIGVVLLFLGIFVTNNMRLRSLHVEGIIAVVIFLLSGFFFYLGYKIFVGVKKK